jgi:HEAT repeat protein
MCRLLYKSKAAVLLSDYVRNDSLLALAMNPAGPPPQAHDVFVKSLSSSNFRTAELGAAGLLKEKGPNAEANQELVRKALDEAPDAKHRLNMLYVISGVRVPSDTLFQAAQKYLYDPDPEVRTAAIDAVGATATDKSKAITVMQNLADSPSLNWEQKNHVKAVLNSFSLSH